MKTVDTIFRGLAILGSVILTICIFPQIKKVYKNKSGKTLSLKFLILAILGLTCLAIYSIYFKLWELGAPIILQTVLYCVLLFMKFYYKKQNEVDATTPEIIVM